MLFNLCVNQFICKDTKMMDYMDKVVADLSQFELIESTFQR